jgi:hypothetical protein
MRRALPIVGIALLLAGILSDPYTFARDGSDAIRAVPLWQLSFAILDIAILLAVVAVTVRAKLRVALLLLTAETLYYLAGNAVLYMRDGPERFIHGIGAESNLSDHVIVVLIRVLLLIYLWFAPRAVALGRLTSA